VEEPAGRASASLRERVRPASERACSWRRRRSCPLGPRVSAPPPPPPPPPRRPQRGPRAPTSCHLKHTRSLFAALIPAFSCASHE
jgi:hypothetical protein